MNLLLLNLGMDVSHTALGFTTSWANSLARRCDHVDVITMFTGDVEVEPNVTVRSLGKELGHSEPRRLLEFYRHLGSILRERPIDVCFAHMAPLFAVLFAPVGKARGIPLMLWYAHGAVSRTMRTAHFLCDRAVTSTPGAFNIPSDKLYRLGQGIDTSTFAPPGQERDGYARTAISIGRLSQVKRIDEMLEAVALVRHEHGKDLRLELTGGPLTPLDEDYIEALHRQAESLQIADSVDFAGPVPFHEIPSRYHHGALFLNLSESTALDKAVLEGMASGCVPISPNESFQQVAAAHGLDWLVPDPGPAGMARTIDRVLEQPPPERAALAERLRAIVESEHSLDALTDKLMGHLTELAAERGRG